MMLPLLAAAVETPLVSPVTVVLQVLAVAAGAFVLITLLLSHLRYQAISREAAVSLKKRANRDALCLTMAEMLKVDLPGLLRVGGFLCEPEELRDALSPGVRKGDRVVVTEEGEVVLLFPPLDEGALSRIAHRLKPIAAELSEQGVMSVAGGVSEVLAGRRTVGRTGRLAAAGERLDRVREVPAVEPDTWVIPEKAPPLPVEILEEERPLLDEVTGVLKPERVGMTFQKLLAAQRRLNQPASIVYAGVDNLEAYAELHGRAAGDAVLRGAAELLLRNCRESDLIGRMEDELVICMSGNSDDLLGACRRMSAAAREDRVVHGEERLRYTLSFGLASYPEHGSAPSRLFERARAALEAARKRGRGVCLMVEPAMTLERKDEHRESESPESF